MMKKISTWVKTHPLIVLTFGFALASPILLIVVYYYGIGLVERMNERNRTISRINSLMETTVLTPPETPDKPPNQHRIPVNKAAINQLTHIFGEMNDEFNKISDQIIPLNQNGHLPMDEKLFPEPGPEDRALYFTIKQKYRDEIVSMLGKGDPGQLSMPRLGAGVPPDPSEVGAALEKIEKDFKKGRFTSPKAEGLTPAERDRLKEPQARKVMEILADKAQSIHIYAQPALGQQDFPLDIGDWSSPGKSDQPKLSDIWDGQMSLWIQQDVLEAIARTNLVSDPGTNVMESPIKRLLSIRLIPGYVGIETEGGMRTEPGGVLPGAGGNSGLPALPSSPTAVGASVNQKISDDFARSPTGRISNPIYDVRHVWVSVIADTQKLPIFMDHLARVNFMTVLKMRISPIEEYDAIREGYVYGSGDSARVDMLVETIWFRDWTAKLMPDEVKDKLGVSKDANKAAGTPR